MTRNARLTAACIVAFVLCAGAAAAAPAAATTSTPAKRDYTQPLASVGASSDFHLMRIEQLRNIPAGSSMGVISNGSATLPLFLEADLEAKGFIVRQTDIYSMVSPRERALTDPSEDFAFLNGLIATMSGAGDKANAGASVDKLLPADKLDLENQLAEHYVALYANLRKLISLLNVDYLVIVSPVFKEISFSMKVYDTAKFDLYYTCLFAGNPRQWRAIVGTPQKSPNLSFDFKADSEPAAFWEMAFSKYAVERLKIGGPAPAPETPPSKK
jgi:hypothetical protein